MLTIRKYINSNKANNISDAELDKIFNQPHTDKSFFSEIKRIWPLTTKDQKDKILPKNEFVIFRQASSEGDVEFVKDLLQCGLDLKKSMLTANSWYALRHATNNQHVKVADLIVKEAGDAKLLADMLSALSAQIISLFTLFLTNKYLENALILFEISISNPALRSRLLDEGSFELLINAPVEKDGTSPISSLILEEINSNPKLIKVLSTTKECLIFTLAAQKGNLTLIDGLLQKASNEVKEIMLTAKDFHAFKWAAENGHTKIVSLILETAKQFPNLIFKMLEAGKYHAIKFAVDNGHFEVAKLLLEAANNVTTLAEDNSLPDQDFVFRVSKTYIGPTLKVKMLTAAFPKNFDSFSFVVNSRSSEDLAFLFKYAKETSQEITEKLFNVTISALHVLITKGKIEKIANLLEAARCNPSLAKDILSYKDYNAFRLAIYCKHPIDQEQVHIFRILIEETLTNYLNLIPDMLRSNNYCLFKKLPPDTPQEISSLLFTAAGKVRLIEEVRAAINSPNAPDSIEDTSTYTDLEDRSLEIEMLGEACRDLFKSDEELGF